MKSFITSLMIGLFFPILMYAQKVNLNRMDSVKRNEYLVQRSKEVIMKFGPDYHAACNSPEITGPFVFDKHDGFYRSDYKKHRGKRYYKVTYLYDHTKFFFSWNHVAYTLIWEKSGEPMAVGFGNGMGKHFLERSFKEWVEMGVKREDIIPYEESEILRRSNSVPTPQKYTERLDSIICTDDMERTMKYELSYDEDGRLHQVRRFLWKDGWQSEGQCCYFYDEDGHNIKLEDYSFGGGTWEKSDKMEVRYDSLGNLVEESLFLAKAGEWEPFTKDVHSYGADGRHMGTLHYYHDDGGWILDGKWEKLFNEKGQVVGNMEYKKEGEAWKERLKAEYEYDEEGNETMYALYSMSDHGWIGYDKFCRTYDEKGMKMSEKRYYWGREGTWKDGAATSIFRDVQGNASSRKVSTTEGGLIAVRTYTYDLGRAASQVMGLQNNNLLYRHVWDSPVNDLNEYAYKILYWKETDSGGSIIEEQKFFYSPIM